MMAEGLPDPGFQAKLNGVWLRRKNVAYGLLKSWAPPEIEHIQIGISNPAQPVKADRKPDKGGHLKGARGPAAKVSGEIKVSGPTPGARGGRRFRIGEDGEPEADESDGDLPPSRPTFLPVSGAGGLGASDEKTNRKFGFG